MLNVFLGTDTTNVRAKAFSFIESIENEDTEVVKMTADTYISGSLLEFTQGTGLFGTTHIVVLDSPFEEEDFEEEVLQNLEALKDSPNQFVLIEGKCDAAKKKKFGKYAENVTEVTEGKKEKFNIFALSEALSRRDKKTLWITLTEARSIGIPNEEIIGILFWQLKVLQLVSKTKSADESGQKPFVYQKAKRALGNFKEGEIEQLLNSLVTIYHEGHLGNVDLDYALEHWVLSV